MHTLCMYIITKDAITIIFPTRGYKSIELPNEATMTDGDYLWMFIV